MFTYEVVRYVSQHPVSLGDNITPESVATCSVRSAVKAFALWGDYEQHPFVVLAIQQFYLKHPNKEGLATVVNDEGPSGVPLARVPYHPVHHRRGVKPQTLNLVSFKVLSMTILKQSLSNENNLLMTNYPGHWYLQTSKRTHILPEPSQAPARAHKAIFRTSKYKPTIQS